jgi:hypothetical protein
MVMNNNSGNRIAAVSRLIVGILCCGVISACASSSAPQAVLSDVAPKAKNALELAPQMSARVQRVKNRILDAKSTSEEREKALNQFSKMGLTTPQKLPFFREIAQRTTDKYIAGSVIKALVKADDPAGFEILTKRMTWLYVETVGDLCLEQLQKYPLSDTRYYQLAEYVAQKVVTSANPKREMFSQTNKGAFLLLALRGEEKDKTLIREALGKVPSAASLWLAACHAQALKEPERLLAKKELQRIASIKLDSFIKPDDAHNEELKLLLKYAQIPVRIALSDVDKESSLFVRSQAERFLAKFGHLTADETISKATYSIYGNPYTEGEKMLYQLRFMNVPFEQNPISQCLDVKNELIRAQAYLVVADRYPQVIFDRLRDGKLNITDKELEDSGFVARLITFCGVKHPEHLQQSKDAISASDRKKALDELRKEGIYTFGSDAGLFLGL